MSKEHPWGRTWKANKQSGPHARRHSIHTDNENAGKRVSEFLTEIKAAAREAGLDPREMTTEEIIALGEEIMGERTSC